MVNLWGTIPWDRAGRICLVSISCGTRAMWPKQRSLDSLFGGKEAQHSGVYEFHTCELCRNVTRCELFETIPTDSIHSVITQD